MNNSRRILSVDIFRGMTIALMILVNTPGTWSSIYAPFRHAEWHGCTPTDLVFPFFLFIVGTSIVLAYPKKSKTTQVYLKILKRSAKLILLGLFLAGFLVSFPFFKAFENLRIPGVLQRIGVVFFFASLLYLHTNWKSLLLVLLTILVGYWAVMTLVSIDGTIPLLTKESNNAAYVDLKILTRAHIWKPTYDPEGLLSTIPAIATTIMGMFLGLLIKTDQFSNKKKLAYLWLTGLAGVVLGVVWGMYFPINKALWTSSFVLYTGGWAFLIFGIIYYFTEIKKHTNWGLPFIYYGSNAITVYFLSSFIAKTFYLSHFSNGQSPHAFFYKTFFTSWINTPKLSSLLYAFSVILFYYFLARFLYKKKIFIKV